MKQTHYSIEPTEIQAECKHEQVFADYDLASDPPQCPWICRLCGLQGVDRHEMLRPTETYDNLVKKFSF